MSAYFSFARTTRAVLRVAVLLLVSLLAATAMAAKPSITLEDLLGAERFGKAEFAPDGQAFAFVRRMPIADQPTWGYGYSRLVRSRVFVVRDAGSPPVAIPNTRNVHYALPSRSRIWSPDGRWLLLLATTRQGFGLALYDRAGGGITRLPGRPIDVYPRFDWIGEDRLIYFAAPDGVQQRTARNEVQANVQARWNGAFHGSKPQVTVSSVSPVFETSRPRPGALILANPREGTTRKFSTGRFYAIAISPDNRYLAAVRAAEPSPNALNYFGKRGELLIFRLGDPNRPTLLHRYTDIDVSASPISGDALAWSPSGDRLLLVGAPTGHGRSGARLYVADIRSGQLHAIKSPPGWSFATSGGWDWGHTLPISWMGKQPVAVVAHPAAPAATAPQHESSRGTRWEYGAKRDVRFDVVAFGDGQARNLTAFAKASVNRFLVPAGNDALLVVADGVLWKVTPGLEPQRLSPRDAPRIESFGIGPTYPEPSMRSAYFHSSTEERVALSVRVDGETRRAVLELTSGTLRLLGVHGEIVATAADQRTTLSELQQGWTSTLLLRNDGGQQVVASLNDDLRGRAISAIRSFAYSYEGRSLNGWVMLPPGSKAGARLPAIVSVYGGKVFGKQTPPSQAKPGFLVPQYSGQLLAAQGYAVIYPSTPLGPGARTNVMETLAGEVVAAVAAAAAQDFVDPERVGVMGVSFGGYSTAAILAERSDLFRAGISMAGIYGWIAGYGSLRMAHILRNDGDIHSASMKYVETSQIGLGAPFWQAPEAYMRNSPIFRVEDIDAPLLMLHGDFDIALTGLPLAMRMYNAMLRSGKKNMALVRYWGQGHVAEDAWAIRDQWSRITTWFDHYVKHADQPDPAATTSAANPD